MKGQTCHHYFFTTSFNMLVQSSCSHGVYSERPISTWSSHSHHWIVLRWALSTLALLDCPMLGLQGLSLSHVLQTEHEIIDEVSSPQLQSHSPTFSHKWLCPVHFCWHFSCWPTKTHTFCYKFDRIFVLTDKAIISLAFGLISLTLRRQSTFSSSWKMLHWIPASWHQK